MEPLSKRLPALAPAQGLTEHVMFAVARAERRAAFINRCISGATALGALATLGLSVSYAAAAASASGFTNYLVLAFSTDAALFPREIALALVESAPLAFIALSLAALAALVWAGLRLRFTNRPRTLFA